MTGTGLRKRKTEFFRRERSCRSWRGSWGGGRRCSCTGRPVCNRRTGWRSRSCALVRSAKGKHKEFSSLIVPWKCSDKSFYKLAFWIGETFVTKVESPILLSMTFQALNQDLLRVSMQLECVEEQMQSRSNVRQNGGVTREELVRERDILIKRRDILTAQLEDNGILAEQVRKKGHCVSVMHKFSESRDLNC